MARLLVEALIAGPTAAEKQNGAAAPFPNGSVVQSVNLRDGTLVTVLVVPAEEGVQVTGVGRQAGDAVERWEPGTTPDPIDKAIMATRMAVFPLHGLDPYP